MDMLHALSLGIFKCTRDCFFDQIGEKSRLASEINGLAKEYGKVFTRQSDRDLPLTSFGRGIQKGKLMGEECRGVLLCMAAVLRSSMGKDLLSKQRGGAFKDPDVVTDWIMLVETLLQWEMWLKSDEMLMKHIKAARHYHRYIMYLIKKVGKRSKGMGLKIMKFHAIMHLVDDILNFGVPMEVDTGSNEAGHKKTKKAALLTQKKECSFDAQTSMRLQEVALLDLAKEELEGRPLWDY